MRGIQRRLAPSKGRHPIAVLASVAMLAQGTPTFAETLYCSTRQGIRTCSSPDGYRSTERSRDGMRFGQDSDGYRWTTSRWRDTTITTLKPPPER
jgi:hypothetical protein